MASWYVGGTVMSRSSSASSLPDDRVVTGTGAPQRWVEAGKRRVSFTEPLDREDEWPEGSELEERRLGFFRPQVKRPRRHVNHHYYLNEQSSRSAAELDRVLPPAFYVIREAEAERSRVEMRPPPSHTRKSTSGYDDRISTNYAVAADALARDYGGGAPHSNFKITNNNNNSIYNSIDDNAPSPQPGPPPPPPGRSPVLMEKTLSGLSISSDTDYDSYVEEEEQQQRGDYGAGAGAWGTTLMTDDQAARRVEQHLAMYRQRNRDSKHERILKSLICPRAVPGGHDQFEIDDEALQGIFYAANELFFQGRLKGRVTWDWSSTGSNSDSDSEGGDGSSSAHSKYRSKIIGTTALRRAGPDMGGGYETLIVLSQPILKDRRYNRRLLISTFLHELIHSYLFVCCGFQARRAGGHTDGFRRIARLIDRWVGPQILYLCNMEADLKDFLVHSASPSGESGSAAAGLPGHHHHHHAHAQGSHHHHHDLLHQHHVLDSCQVLWPTDDGVPYAHAPPAAYHTQFSPWHAIR